jgi:hypothetical protein
MRTVFLTSADSPLARKLVKRFGVVLTNRPSGWLLDTRFVRYIYLPLHTYHYLSFPINRWQQECLFDSQAIFFVSPRSVIGLQKAWEALLISGLVQVSLFDWLSARRCFAVGKQTALTVLQLIGQVDVFYPKHGSGEIALLHELTEQIFSHTQCLWVRGQDRLDTQQQGHGSSFLIESLKEIGAEVQTLSLYQREDVDWGPVLKTTITKFSPDDNNQIWMWDVMTRSAVDKVKQIIPQLVLPVSVKQKYKTYHSQVTKRVLESC